MLKIQIFNRFLEGKKVNPVSDRLYSIMRNKITAGLILFLFILPFAAAQYDKEEFQEFSWKERFFYGGSFGLMFGTITDIEISPIVGYRLTRNLSLAVGPRYRYYRDSRVTYSYAGQPTQNYVLEGHIYGGRSYLQFHVIGDINDVLPVGLHAGIFLHTEYEALSLENEDFRPWREATGRFTLHSFFIGGGVRFPAGRRAALNLMVLWNLNESSDSPYTSPVLRFGFTF